MSGSLRYDTQPFAPRSMVWPGMSLSSIARLHPSARSVPSLPRWSYASFVSTSVSAASPAAADSGLPLNVPCWAAPFVTHSMNRASPPNAPIVAPPPTAFAYAARWGRTPKRSVVPPYAIVPPHFTSS